MVLEVRLPMTMRLCLAGADIFLCWAGAMRGWGWVMGMFLPVWEKLKLDSAAVFERDCCFQGKQYCEADAYRNKNR